MARHKGRYWNLGGIETVMGGSRDVSWDDINAALLMDLRDELQTLNRLLGCTNFTRIPRVLDDIKANTKRRGKRKPLRLRRTA